MAADLHIHVVTDDEVEKHVRESFKKEYSTNSYGDTWANCYDEFFIRGTWYTFNNLLDNFEWSEVADRRTIILDYNEEKVDNTPNIWVGEVSWLKAALFEDNETFIPSAVMMISELIGHNLPLIDDDFISKIREAFNQPNHTTKEGGVFGGNGYSLADVNEVCQFLEEYKGKKCFTISW